MTARPGLPIPVPTDIDCPPWCQRGTGHPYRAHAEGLRRVHVRHLADLDRWGLTLTADQVEQAASPVGPIDLGRFATALAPASTTFEAIRCTPADLRDLAAALTAAADTLDGIHSTLPPADVAQQPWDDGADDWANDTHQEG